MKIIKSFTFMLLITLNSQCSKAQKMDKISFEGLAQIGISLSPNQKYFAYIDLSLDSNKKFIESVNIVRVQNLTKVIHHIPRIRFFGFYKDSIILILNEQNKLCTYNLENKLILQTYELITDNNTYLNFCYKIEGDKIYYKKHNQILSYDLNTRMQNIIVSDDLGKKHLVGFDIHGNKLILCYKEFNMDDKLQKYNIYLYNFEDKLKKQIYTDSTEEITYEPYIFFYSNDKVMFSFYKNGKTYLFSYNLPEEKVYLRENFGDYKIISFSVINDGEKLITFLDEKQRNLNDTNNYISNLVRGCNIYKVN